MSRGASPRCHASAARFDGECIWEECPQAKDWQPRCPLDDSCPECDWGDVDPWCGACGGTGHLNGVTAPKGASAQAAPPGTAAPRAP